VRTIEWPKYAYTIGVIPAETGYNVLYEIAMNVVMIPAHAIAHISKDVIVNLVGIITTAKHILRGI